MICPLLINVDFGVYHENALYINEIQSSSIFPNILFIGCILLKLTLFIGFPRQNTTEVGCHFSSSGSSQPQGSNPYLMSPHWQADSLLPMPPAGSISYLYSILLAAPMITHACFLICKSISVL